MSYSGEGHARRKGTYILFFNSSFFLIFFHKSKENLKNKGCMKKIKDARRNGPNFVSL